MSSAIAIRHDEALQYPQRAPYDPGGGYSELTGIPVSDEPNGVYDAVRQCFLDLGMDAAHAGTPDWQPFADLVKPGNTVVIKPNLVRHTYDEGVLQSCVTTHPSVIRPIIDYCWQAMDGRGRIIVGDAPSTETDFDEVARCYGLRDMIETLRNRGVAVELMDFRGEKTVMENGIWVDEQPIDHAPESQIVDLGEASFFCAAQYEHVKFHGGGYDMREMAGHHQGKRQEYCVSKVILNADVVISVPKLKTHKKAGITCCMKNLVGINTNKNFLPHWIQGSSNQGGDEMPALKGIQSFNLRCINFYKEHIQSRYWRQIDRTILKAAKWMNRKEHKQKGGGEDRTDYSAWLMNFFLGQTIFGGAWRGNETICRMILDLNRIFLQCGRDGSLKDCTDRKVFYVVDAVTMGQKNGPMRPEPLQTHMVAAGYNGLRLDTQLIRLLNLDPLDIPLYKLAWQQGTWLCGEDGDLNLFNGEDAERVKTRLPYQVTPADNWQIAKLS